jgi:hypothetical protein
VANPCSPATDDRHFVTGRSQHKPGPGSEAAEQRDAADEGRLEPGGSIILGRTIVKEGKVVRPSQLIASVGPTTSGESSVLTRRPDGPIPEPHVTLTFEY